jgi:translation initiation factor 1
VSEDKPFNSPFASLAPLRGSLPPAKPAEPPAAPSAPSKQPPGSKPIPRAVVRMERSGRGGKEVTVVEQLQLSASEREKWLKELKASLGCGGVVEGEALMLQGDHRKRLPEILTRRGVKRVIIG